MRAPEADDIWVGLGDGSLPVDAVSAWVIVPSCGASVVFTGTVRDHSDGRDGVTRLSYEAFESLALERLAAVGAEARRRWPELGRIALLHRVGDLAVGDAAVVVAVSAPHRDQAFAAARFGIDAVKATVPIWKHEKWDGGSGFGVAAQPLVALDRFEVAS